MEDIDKKLMVICKHLLTIKDNIPSKYEYRTTDGVTFYSCKECIEEFKQRKIDNFVTVCRGKCVK